MRRRSLNLLERFSLLSFFAVLLLCLALGFVSAHLLASNMLDWEWQGTAELVRYQVRAYSLERLFTDPQLGQEPQQYRGRLGSLLSLPEVVRVKVWDREGAVIWSDDGRLIGRKFPENRELQEALAGQISVQLKDLKKSENVYERQFPKLAEVYVPIFAEQHPGTVLGVLEVYKVPARLFGTIRRVRALVWGTSLTGGLLLYLSLFWIARVSSRTQLSLERSLKEQSAELKDRNTTLEFFVQTISHELKSPSVAIHGLVGRLLETCQDRLGDEGQRLLRRLQTNAEHQERLLTDLLALTRLGKERATPTPVDTSVLLQEVIGEAQQDGSVSPVKVTIQSPMPILYCDQRELLEVFRHLITNAIRFMGDRLDPQVEIAAADHGEWVEFSVQDNGIGIDPAYHERVFEIFQRLKEIETEGTGVGLAIVKKIIEGTGGTIWVESFKGQGSTFRFTWPKAKAEVS